VETTFLSSVILSGKTSGVDFFRRNELY